MSYVPAQSSVRRQEWRQECITFTTQIGRVPVAGQNNVAELYGTVVAITNSVNASAQLIVIVIAK